MIRILPALAILLLAIAATWFIARRTAVPPAEPTPSASPTAAVAAATPTRGASGAVAATTPSPSHRLAGTVVGDVQFAVIEAPDGSNELYAIDDDVPGLGKLIAIGPRSATFEGSDGPFDMPLVSAPTPTPRAAEDIDEDEDQDTEIYDEVFIDEPGDDEWIDESEDGDDERLDGE